MTKFRRLELAGWTGLEPAAFRVTGGRYNQLNYHPAPNSEWAMYEHGWKDARDFSRRSDDFLLGIP